MKTIFQKMDADELTERINKLTPETQRRWGKMNVNQMLAHCTEVMKSATGEVFYKSNLFIRLIGGMMKSMTTNDKPFKKGSPTMPGFIFTDTEGFEKKRNELINIVKKFNEGGEAGCTSNPHAFFGRLTPVQWGSLMYKHIDHHLRQFGV